MAAASQSEVDDLKIKVDKLAECFSFTLESWQRAFGFETPPPALFHLRRRFDNLEIEAAKNRQIFDDEVTRMQEMHADFVGQFAPEVAKQKVVLEVVVEEAKKRFEEFNEKSQNTATNHEATMGELYQRG